MTKRLALVDEESAVNSVGARLAVYAVLAGAAGAGAAIALRRHHRKSSGETDTDAGPTDIARSVPDRTPPLPVGFRRDDDPGRAGIA
jgi:hypothetical protein